MKNISHNSLFLIAAWALLLLTLLFFGFQWRSVNIRLANLEEMMTNGLATSEKLIEANLEQLLSRCNQAESCGVEEVMRELQKIVRN